jgi:hypothetical protein
MSNANEIQSAICLLEPDAPIELVADIHGQVENFLRLAKELKAQCDEHMKAWIKTNGPLVLGDNVTKLVKQEKSEKPRDLRQAIEACLLACSGDFDTFAGLISANGIKPGAAKRLLGDKFEEVFETTWRDVLVDGKPGAKLVTVNTKFLQI